MNLFKMFDEAKRRCLNRLRDFTCARIPLPWAAAIADEIAAGYGPDPYPYGIQESRPTISRINLEFYSFNQQFLRVFNLLPLALLSDGKHRPGLD